VDGGDGQVMLLYPLMALLIHANCQIRQRQTLHEAVEVEQMPAKAEIEGGDYDHRMTLCLGQQTGRNYDLL